MFRRLGQPGELSLIAKNVADGTRPAATVGTSLTPTQNSYPAATELIAAGSITDDIYAVKITLGTWAISTEGRTATVRIYLGGQLWIPDLLAQSYSVAAATGLYTSYYFPIWGASGQAISAAASVSTATLTAGRIIVHAYGKPRGAVWAGTVCRAFGVGATSNGTVVVPGTTSEGSYVELGTLAETLHYWEFGVANNNAVTASQGHFFDTAIGDASNKRAIHTDEVAWQTNAETIAKASSGRFVRGASGDKVYGRAQASGTPEADMSMIMYGVG